MCKSDCVSSVILFLGVFLVMICVAQETVIEGQSRAHSPLSPVEINQLQAKAQSGDPTAQVALGKAYEDGNGVPQSDVQAMKWYRAAADLGNSTAQDDVGLMFRFGRGVEHDKGEALKWYRKAAKQEHPNAMFNLGAAYYNGDGIRVDDVAAYAWFLLASKFGSQPATDATKHMKETGTSEADALEKIGDMYVKGDELPQNSNEAVNWYRKAAEIGEARAQIKLADLLLNGENATPSNYGEARLLCEKAANLHFSPGAYCMGQLYEHGLGVEQDLPKAAKWFSAATKLGNGFAAFRLGEMYWKGEGVKQDRISAYEFIYLASTYNLPEAMQEKERLEKELTPKEVKRGNAKAVDWTRQHQPPLVLGRKPLAPN